MDHLRGAGAPAPPPCRGGRWLTGAAAGLLLAAGGLGPAPATAQGWAAEDLVAAFARACLDTLPEFADAGPRLREMGFSVDAYEGGLHEIWHPAAAIGGGFVAGGSPGFDAPYCQLMDDAADRGAVHRLLGGEIARRWGVGAAARTAAWIESEGWVFEVTGGELAVIVDRSMSDRPERGATVTVEVRRGPRRRRGSAPAPGAVSRGRPRRPARPNPPAAPPAP